MAEKKTDVRYPYMFPIVPGVADQDQFETFFVNGKCYQINRGEMVDLPEEVMEIVRNNAMDEKKAREYTAALLEKERSVHF